MLLLSLHRRCFLCQPRAPIVTSSLGQARETLVQEALAQRVTQLRTDHLSASRPYFCQPCSSPSHPSPASTFLHHHDAIHSYCTRRIRPHSLHDSSLARPVAVARVITTLRPRRVTALTSTEQPPLSAPLLPFKVTITASVNMSSKLDTSLDEILSKDRSAKGKGRGGNRGGRRSNAARPAPSGPVGGVSKHTRQNTHQNARPAAGGAAPGASSKILVSGLVSIAPHLVLSC